MLKFSLTVNQQTQDGFKLSVQADDEASMKIAHELTNRLIEKITKIEVTVQNESYE